MYQDLTIGNKSFIKRFSHSKRFEFAIDLLAFCADDKYLDYGTGDGYMLKLAERSRTPPSLIVGYEPIETQYVQASSFISEGITSSKIYISASELCDEGYNKISCLEVLEHLSDKLLAEALFKLYKILRKDGLLVISVPIETGIAGFVKNLIRLFLRQAHDGTSFSSVFRSLFGLEVIRPDCDYISSHVGFNHNRLESLFSDAGFFVENKFYSPFPSLGSLANSQIFFCLRKCRGFSDVG